MLVTFIWTLQYNHRTSSLEVTQVKSAQSCLSLWSSVSSECRVWHFKKEFESSNAFFFCKGAGYKCGWAKCGRNSGSPSGNIVVLVRSLFVTFHVVSVYERLDPLLQIARLWERKQFTCWWTLWADKRQKNENKKLITGDLDRKFQLVVELWHQQIMTEGLPHLHDAHHSSIDLVLPVLKHTLCGTDLLLYLKGK